MAGSTIEVMRTLGIVALIVVTHGPATPVRAQGTPAGMARGRVQHRAVFQNSSLTESSGVAVSRSQPGVLWTLNDSGNPPDVFATDTLGRDLGSFSHPDLRNNDWEALSLGPCPGGGHCLYIGDVGDNHEVRTEVQVYRWTEPSVSGEDGARSPPQRLRIRYPDHGHDVEAMFVTPGGSVYLVSKGRSGGVGVYRVGPAAWNQRDATVTAELLQRLAIPVGQGMSQQVTDAAMAPDGSSVAVRTYRYLSFYRLDARGHLTIDPARPVCDLGGLEPQGEGVDWLDNDRLVITSEEVLTSGRTVQVITCKGQ